MLHLSQLCLHLFVLLLLEGFKLHCLLVIKLIKKVFDHRSVEPLTNDSTPLSELSLFKCQYLLTLSAQSLRLEEPLGISLSHQDISLELLHLPLLLSNKLFLLLCELLLGYSISILMGVECLDKSIESSLLGFGLLAYNRLTLHLLLQLGQDHIPELKRPLFVQPHQEVLQLSLLFLLEGL